MLKTIKTVPQGQVIVEKLSKYAESSRRANVFFSQSELGTLEGNFLLALIERWGMVSAKPDGEDSTGRAKLALLSEEEVVVRATKTTKLAYSALRENGWLLAVPTIEEAEEMVKEWEDKNA